MVRILVAEDNQNLIYQLQIELTMQGYEVSCALDGLEALEHLKNQPTPDLIISDVSMPRMDGFEFYRAVRNNPAWLDIPFILLTARDSDADKDLGYGLGVDDYIVKPFQTEHLLRVITAKLKRRQMLQASLEDQRTALERVKKDLTQMVAHELRTPLVSINLVLQIISRQMGQLSEAQLHELLDTMSAGSNRLNRLTDQMVFLTQLEAGALTQEGILESGFPTNLSDIVAAAIKRARLFAYRQPDIPVQLNERDRQIKVTCDKRALEHAFAEVISNAMVFSPSDGSVEVNQWQSNGRTWVSVTDHGIGMSSDQVSRAMQKFQQINRESQEQQGVGLGLPLAINIIEAHGGSLAIKSALGNGTQVLIELPIQS
ncbi:MAG: response regulator [Chloroflexi bacterium]|nr:response regulator [Chloroflexota bacterium]